MDRSRARDLYSIANYIRRDNAAAAQRVLASIRQGCHGLLSMPKLGHSGKEAGTRELVLTPLPYVIVYRIRNDSTEVLRIWHGAQDR